MDQVIEGERERENTERGVSKDNVVSAQQLLLFNAYEN
jgi:hypothetical protein